MKTPEEKAEEWARIHYPPTRRPNNPYLNHHDWHIAKASYLAGLKEGGWLPYPENKPEQVGWVLAYNSNPSTCQVTVKWWNGEFAGNECIVAWMPIPPYTKEV